MKYLIIAVFVIIVGFLVWRGKKNTDPAEQACAREIGDCSATIRVTGPDKIVDARQRNIY